MSSQDKTATTSPGEQGEGSLHAPRTEMQAMSNRSSEVDGASSPGRRVLAAFDESRVDRVIDLHELSGVSMPARRRALSRRKIAVTVGILFIVQMVTAMFGTSLIEAFVDGDTNRAPLTVGVLLMLCSGIAVVCIGLLMYQVLKDVNPGLAFWYPVLRVIELTVSTMCGIYLLTQLEVVPNHLLWIYIPTGIGGVILTYLLWVSRLVPRPIAALGLVGYLSLLLGVPLDLLGLLDMNKGPGRVLLVPGGLFEFVFMPIWLIAKGFGPRPPVRGAESPTMATTG